MDQKDMPVVGVFPWVPPFAQGLVRELRVRWALEEAGLDYKEMLNQSEDQISETHRKLHPFSQISVYEDSSLFRQVYSRRFGCNSQ